MLVLTRKCGERIIINPGPDQVMIEVVDIDRNKTRIGIDAPRHMRVLREELIGYKQDGDELIPTDKET